MTWNIMPKVILPNGVVAYECKHLPTWPRSPDGIEYTYWSCESTGNPLLPQEKEGVQFDSKGKALGAEYI